MFISRVYRPDKRWPWYTLLALEFPMTVALLALFGIADPNTYRTKLWADGAANGFNSSPETGLYAAANYRPYTTPAVWSQFITSFNVVISVLSTFILIVKIPMYIVHCFPPLLSAFAHGALVALYAVSIRYQAGSDMSDPKRPQPGPPWYITKSCSVAHDPNNIHYCQQAKAAFACTVVAIALFAFQTAWSLYSLWPSKSARELNSEKASRAKSAYAEAAALSPAPSTAHRSLFPASLRSPRDPSDSNTSWGKEAAGPNSSLAPLGTRSKGFGGMVPMTPRTQAFNRLGGTADLPLRNHFSSPNAPRSPTFGVKSPLATTFESISDVERGNSPPLPPTNDSRSISPLPPHTSYEQQQQSQSHTPEPSFARHGSPQLSQSDDSSVGERGRGPMYFPPPPKAGEGRKGKK